MADFIIVILLIVGIVMIVKSIKKSGGKCCNCGSTSCPHSKKYKKI